ncbi:hypothetical protein MAR_020647 [Mya arenaria]|uniref:Uncharacterized protein n=1 Tax=Mya arenaria TaxID=6604 RepID=A0ABY7E5K0_MYAAR|nr:hypothetical protein MAR_020647 [Mya arenaria]
MTEVDKFLFNLEQLVRDAIKDNVAFSVGPSEKSNKKTIDVTKQRNDLQLEPGHKSSDQISGNDKPVVDIFKECIADTFKILSAEVSHLNHQCQDTVKNKLLPQFNSLCDADQRASNSHNGPFGTASVTIDGSSWTVL